MIFISIYNLSPYSPTLYTKSTYCAFISLYFSAYFRIVGRYIIQRHVTVRVYFKCVIRHNMAIEPDSVGTYKCIACESSVTVSCDECTYLRPFDFSVLIFHLRILSREVGTGYETGSGCVGDMPVLIELYTLRKQTVKVSGSHQTARVDVHYITVLILFFALHQQSN